MTRKVSVEYKCNICGHERDEQEAFEEDWLGMTATTGGPHVSREIEEHSLHLCGVCVGNIAYAVKNTAIPESQSPQAQAQNDREG